MAEPTAITQAHVDVLDKAIAQGALRVDFPDGGGITYRSVDELLRAWSHAKERLAAAAGTQESQSLASYSKD